MFHQPNCKVTNTVAANAFLLAFTRRKMILTRGRCKSRPIGLFFDKHNHIYINKQFVYLFSSKISRQISKRQWTLVETMALIIYVCYLAQIRVFITWTKYIHACLWKAYVSSIQNILTRLLKSYVSCCLLQLEFNEI